ncbi:energy transducer TonB [Sphingomonas kyeonggiensis]|uniref:Protein TonB n=1 Tax=Sphingomonas kyeonggiensis TaxID=1268553 RepID=A0A7W6NY09_9SPHN|nr:energy transducer TonB [Sphingomonas kyeonggiensis]MBB4099878.1 protein TonB [Sphingomonas kyeonggiensis]
MYAEHRYQPQQSRVASIGASLLISGAIITGMIYSAPNIARILINDPIETYNVRETVPPPPIEPPKLQPKVEAKTPTQPLPTVPDTIVKTDSRLTMETTKDIPPVQPEITKPVEPGPPVIVEPAKPLPPFVGARRDPRYAEAFQPNYPASELRAQRDGRVSVRVLVSADGRVKAVEQVSATSQAFFEATRQQALSKWRFKPATRGGVAEESWMTLSVTFQIKDQ